MENLINDMMYEYNVRYEIAEIITCIEELIEEKESVSEIEYLIKKLDKVQDLSNDEKYKIERLKQDIEKYKDEIEYNEEYEEDRYEDIKLGLV